MILKKIIFIAILILGFSTAPHCETYYIVSQPDYADEIVYVDSYCWSANTTKVYFVNNKDEADCAIYPMPFRPEADTVVYIESYPFNNQAKKICLAKSAYEADLLVYQALTRYDVKGHCGYAAALL